MYCTKRVEVSTTSRFRGRNPTASRRANNEILGTMVQLRFWPTGVMPQSLGPYSLIKRIAIGGTAEIYLARKKGQLGGFEKYYALKVILPQRQGDEEAEKVMVDEARLTSQLQHDNIVGVLDLDQDDGRLYMVMEYVRGQDLSMVLDALRRVNGLLAIEVAAYIAREACAGLQYAHTRTASDGQPLGLVHRDVSPQNIIVGVEGDVKLIDFGVAKMRGRGRIETKTGIIKGKLRYMAPEYAIGNQQDSRSDIFAVGLCLFELMTGRPAYDDAEYEGTELLERIKTAEIPRPSTLRDDVPPELDAICAKALAAHPDDRYQTALEMQKELAVYLANAAPDFTKAHLSTYVSRLFEKLSIMPEGASEVNADGVDANDLRASRSTPGPAQAIDASDHDSTDPVPIPEDARLPGEGDIPDELPPELEPTDVSIEVREVRGESWNTPTGELKLDEPKLERGPSKTPDDEADLDTAQLMTQSGFNRLVKRRPDEDSYALIDTPDRLKTTDLKIPRPSSLKKKTSSKADDSPEESPPAEIEISMADRIPTGESPVLTSADDVTMPVDSSQHASHVAGPREPTGETEAIPDAPTEGLERPIDAIAEAPTEGLQRPADAVLPGAAPISNPAPASTTGDTDRSQPIPIHSHPMTGAPIDASHADSSAAFPAHYEAATESNPRPRTNSPPGADVSASFQARPGSAQNADVSASFQARPDPSAAPQADSSASFNANPDVSASFQARPDMSGSIQSHADMSGSFTPAPEKKEGGTGSRIGFRAFSELQERYYDWIATEKGRRKANTIVVTVIGVIFVSLLIWTLFMLPS